MLRILGRRIILVLATLLLGSQVAAALSYYQPSPSGAVGLSRPVITQKLDLAPGERISSAELWLDGVRLFPTWDETGRVSYQPDQPLAPGTHEAKLRVLIAPAEPGFFYDPVESTFSFSVAANAVAQLPEPGPEELRALAHVNQYRKRAGLPEIAYDQSLAAAAHSHANYLVLNPAQIEANGHAEQPGALGYTGRAGADRVHYFTYDGGSAEVINFVDRAEDAIDGWIDTLYHRIPLLHPGMTEMGYGLAGDSTWRVNVIEAGPYALSAGVVTWPYAGQTDVPPLWDGAETPDPLELYPEVEGPVGYPVTITFGGTVETLSLTDWSLTGPDGEVRVLRFDPTNDPRLEDTVGLIPASPLRPGATYTVRMSGQVDTGTGPKAFQKTWWFQTQPEFRPIMQSRVVTASSSGELRSIRVEGSHFGPGLTAYLDGLPVQGFELVSPTQIAFQPPAGYAGGKADLLLVTPGGREHLWSGLLSGQDGYRLPTGSPFSSLPVSVRGVRLEQPGLAHDNGAVLLPEAVLEQLGGRVQRAEPINRAFWRIGQVEGEYTLGRVTASVNGSPLRLQLPVRTQNGTTYVDSAFAQGLAGVHLQIAQGVIYLGTPIFGIMDIEGHWAVAQIERLLQAKLVSGYGDGTFRPDAPLSRAAFVKMLVAANDLPLRPGETGGFTDVAAHWSTAQGYLGAAVAAGIVLPFTYPQSAFEPDRPITREEMAVMITRSLGLEREAETLQVVPVNGVMLVGDLAFLDAQQWSQPGYIAVAVEAGIITGYRENDGRYTFRPTKRATRAEAAVMIVRSLQR